jgi:hemerythrin-like domain-containing protein
MGPFDILAEQHRELEEQLEALTSEQTLEEPEAKADQLQALTALLELHARLEERHLRPLLARVEGRIAAREEAEDHLAMVELAEELQELAPGEEEWWARLTALEDLIVAHMRQEEAETFPRLSSLLGQDEQEALRRALWSQHEQWLSSTGPVSATGPLLDEPRGEV